jgi:four helix bundle protein
MRQDGFESLRVWQNARILVNSIYDIMKDNKDFGFRDQIQRASISIMNNIAEGFESGSDKMYIRYLMIAKASCSEVRSMLYICLDRNFCTQESFDDLRECTIQISSQLFKLLDYLNTGKCK